MNRRNQAIYMSLKLKERTSLLVVYGSLNLFDFMTIIFLLDDFKHSTYTHIALSSWSLYTLNDLKIFSRAKAVETLDPSSQKHILWDKSAGKDDNTHRVEFSIFLKRRKCCFFFSFNEKNLDP